MQVPHSATGAAHRGILWFKGTMLRPIMRVRFSATSPSLEDLKSRSLVQISAFGTHFRSDLPAELCRLSACERNGSIPFCVRPVVLG